MSATRLITVLMLVVAVIHLLPLSGVIGVEQLVALYGVEIADPSLEILMRHRAILFGILGAFFAYAAFKPAVQPLAFAMALVSISSFFLLTASVGEFNQAVWNVVIADLIAAAALTGAVLLYTLHRKLE